MRSAELVAERVERALGPHALDSFEHPCLPAALPCAQPRAVAELSELLRLAAAEGWRVLPVGAGSKLGWSPPPARADLALSTRGLSGVVAYEPADGTLTALAGTPLDELEQSARAGGHRLTPDVARPAAATLGGVVAAGQSGICRLRLGPLRNHVLGLAVALSDGRVVKSGGRLVKNVTGFDLHRLHAGAHGALGVIVEVSLRLFALPAHEAVLSGAATRLAEVLSAAQRVREASFEPLGLLLEAGLGEEDARPRVHVLLAGRPEGVARDLERARAALDLADCELREGDEARALRRRLRDLEPAASEVLSLHVTCRPSQLERTLDATLEWLGARDLPRTFSCQPGLATLDVSLGAASALGADQAQELRRAVLDLRLMLAPRARLELRGGCLAAPEELEARPLLELQRRVRAALDPGGHMASDRLRGPS